MRRWIKGVLLGVTIGLGGTMLGLSPLGTQFELNVGKAWLFNLRGAITPPAKIVVVGINGQTSEQLGLPASPRDWPRSIHATLIKKLVELGASVIVFDVFFQTPKKSEDDLALAREINDAGRVVLVEKLTGKRQPITDSQGRNSGIVWVEERLPPMQMFAQAAKGLAPFPLPKIDAAVHDFWTFKVTAGNTSTMPAIAVQLDKLVLYPEWLALVKQLNVQGSEQFPDSIAGYGSDNQIGRLMVSIRNLYEAHPELSVRMRELIQNKFSDEKYAVLKNELTMLNDLYSGPAQRFINFYGAPGTIQTIPYQSVIKGYDLNLKKKDAFYFHNKIVFVGFSDLYDPGQPDRFYSVFSNDDGIDLSGVEIAATACANLLTDKTLNALGFWKTGILLLCFGVIMAVLIYLLPAIAGVPIAIALAILYVVGAQWGFNNQELWMPLATPMLVQFPLALFLGLMGQYFLERHRGQRMRQTLKYYVPDNIVRELTENRLDPSVTNKVVYSTCLATDMAGFSTLAEKMPPDELATVLNDYFDTLAQPLKKHHVDVTEFRADAIMCAWTAATPEIKIRQKAVTAALGAVEAITLFKERYSQVDTNIRIGLEAGTVYVGHAGGGGHFVYSIVGDCANTASRVESLNKHLKTKLLATGSVVEGLDNLLIRPLSKFQFVGKTEALPIVEIVSAYDAASVRQIEFCEKFTGVLALFHKGRWKQAEAGFASFLESYPDDGPAQFYLGWCRGYISGSTNTDEPGVIRMVAK
jgi:adenylate cyclase